MVRVRQKAPKRFITLTLTKQALRSELVWKAKEPKPLTNPSMGLRVYLTTSRFGEGIRPGCLIEVTAFW